MDNVLLLPQHMTTVKIKRYKNSGWDSLGNWNDGVETIEKFQGGIFPFQPSDFKNYPEGFIKNDDRKLITKYELQDNDIVEISGQEFKIITLQSYGYLADINFYVLRRVANSRTNQKIDK